MRMWKRVRDLVRVGVSMCVSMCVCVYVYHGSPKAFSGSEKKLPLATTYAYHSKARFLESLKQVLKKIMRPGIPPFRSKIN